MKSGPAKSLSRLFTREYRWPIMMKPANRAKQTSKLPRDYEIRFEQKYAPLSNVGFSVAFCGEQNISHTLQANNLIVLI